MTASALSDQLGWEHEHRCLMQTESCVMAEWLFAHDWRPMVRAAHDSESGHLEGTKMSGEKGRDETWYR